MNLAASRDRRAARFSLLPRARRIVLLLGLDAMACSRAAAAGEAPAPRYHEFVMAGAHLTAAPEWIRSVDQRGGAFLQQPSRWHVGAEAPEGVGSLIVALDRSKLSSDLAVTLLHDDDPATDYVIQLLDDEDRVVLADPVGNVASAQRRSDTATFVVPLSRHAGATRIAVRRVAGPLTMVGVVLFPVSLPAEQSGAVIDEIDLLTLLKAPLAGPAAFSCQCRLAAGRAPGA